MTPPNISIVLIMLCFWVTLWLVNRFLIRPVNTVLDQRHEQIDGAEKAWTTKNEELLSATARIEDELVEAARAAAKTRETYRTGAYQEKQQQLDLARKESEKKLDIALDGLSRDAEKARGELREQAESLSRDLVQRLLGREVHP
jgi:F-type H+-transporting ATPase subunit b